MVVNSNIKIAISVLILVSLACGFSIDMGLPTSQPTVNVVDTAIVRSLTETALVQTVVGISIAQTLNAGQQIVQPELPSLTPSITLQTISSTPEKVMLTVSQTTNCRKGPGSAYDWVGALDPGELAEVIARDPFGKDWYIRNPDNSSGFCWIYGEFATVTGNYAALPAFTAIPTPARTSTPTIPPKNFSITSTWILDCFADEHWVNFELLNTGSATWQSWQTILRDTVTGETNNIYADYFYYPAACASSEWQQDLTPGEPGYAYSGNFHNDPAGHLMTGLIKLCTLDGLGGSCTSIDMNFTP